jgi:pseudaminic acid biosynthesis-associated methylase
MSTQVSTVAHWTGDFGREYTARNAMTVAELDELYLRRYAVTRVRLNDIFLGQLPRDIRILEVGCNIGNQLLALRQMGFKRLSGIDVQPNAVETAKGRSESIDFRVGSAFDLPFGDREFDLVFTSGVLIHIAPDDLPRAIAEISRVSSRYVWGCEYFSKDQTPVPYRGHEDLLWKADFAALYQRFIPSLRLMHLMILPYQESPLTDAMFLLEQQAHAANAKDERANGNTHDTPIP